jgi:hypothetical protein
MLGILGGGPSIDVIHEEYAKQRAMVPGARIHAVAETSIAAPLDRIWHLLSDVAGWPTWHRDVRSVQVADGVVPDGRFVWVSNGMKIRSTFAVVDPPHELTWSGSVAGIKAVHRNTLEARDGAVHARSEECMVGPLTVLYRSDKLRQVLDSFLAALKAAAERG